VTHAADPSFMRVDRDYVLLLNAYDIDPGTYTPKVSTMLDFNLWTFNSRAFPGTDPMVARLGERVRIRVGNLSMTNHPIHLHGHEFEVVGTDGGWTPPAARWPEVTTDIAVGQMRAIEFTASAPGDWAFHCHKSHHTMNAMGHSVPTTLGVEQADLAKQIAALVPDYMPMDSGSMGDMPMDSGSMGDMAMDAGSMGDMAKHGGSTGDVAKDGGSMGGMAMSMPLPDNTLPMMTGTGPHGGIEMGGMFTVMKIRAELAAHDYGDPGWYRAPAGSVAYPWAGETPPLRRGG
jgi:hypothetical protein